MVTFGNAWKEISSRYATLTLNGDVVACGRDWRFKFGQDTTEVPVNGTNVPRIIHGTFGGDFSCDYVYCSDETWSPLISAGNLDRTFTLIAYNKDINSTGSGYGGSAAVAVSWTATVKLKDFEVHNAASEGVVRASVSGTFTGYPTKS